MIETTLDNLGQKVKAKRGGAGIRSAAKEMGISSATLSRIERGKFPTIPTFIKICKWLDLDPGPILGFRVTQPTPILTDEDYAYLAQAIQMTIRYALLRCKEENG